MANTIPLISAMPAMGGGAQSPDDLASASPIFQALLSGSGGPQGLQNVNSMAASNPAFGNALSLMSPGGGLSPMQAQQFGPLFALMMSLQGGQTPGQQTTGLMPGMGQ